MPPVLPEKLSSAHCSKAKTKITLLGALHLTPLITGLQERQARAHSEEQQGSAEAAQPQTDC